MQHHDARTEAEAEEGLELVSTSKIQRCIASLKIQWQRCC